MKTNDIRLLSAETIPTLNKKDVALKKIPKKRENGTKIALNLEFQKRNF